MNAGSLRHEILDFQELQIVKNPVSGATKKEYVSILKTRASKRKLTVVVDRDGINASEQFIGNMIVIQVRFNPLIKENMRIVYHGRIYSIQLLDKQPDNTYLITLNKENVKNK